MLFLNLVRAVAWVIVLLLIGYVSKSTDDPIILLASFIAVYAMVLTGADVVNQWLVEKFDSGS